MASLLDIAGVPKTVSIGDQQVAVFGISARGLIALMTRFPEVAKLLNGISVDNEALQALAPEALAAFLAAGTGHPDEAEHEKAAGDLGLGAQVELAEEIIKQTFPRGVGPFVAKLRELGLVGQPSDGTPSTPQSPSQSQG